MRFDGGFRLHQSVAGKLAVLLDGGDLLAAVGQGPYRLRQPLRGTRFHDFDLQMLDSRIQLVLDPPQSCGIARREL